MNQHTAEQVREYISTRRAGLKQSGYEKLAEFAAAYATLLAEREAAVPVAYQDTSLADWFFDLEDDSPPSSDHHPAAPQVPDMALRARVADLLHLLQFLSCDAVGDGDKRAALSAMDDIRAMLDNPVAPQVATPRCDGDHAGPRCADPECWNDIHQPDQLAETERLDRNATAAQRGKGGE
ncbi:hypothetical protein [Chitiniphilus shinanonensis]|uniref:hypothetical protein n=1 Tax=Chitiniphilus shinanonensis TaxID=553088 RepID=UPI0030277348